MKTLKCPHNIHGHVQHFVMPDEILECPLFELLTKDGKNYKIFFDGRSEGFPQGTLIINHVFPLLCRIMNAPHAHIADKKCKPIT
jgi:hypothetical protein